jgi:predicted permease
MDTLIQDVRYAARRLTASPGFSVAALLTLALGIGANSAIFGAIHAMFLRQLPYPDADRLVFVWGHRKEATTPQLPVSLPVVLDLREHARSFDVIEAWTSTPDTRFALTGAGDPQDVQYAVVTAGLLRLLGADPVVGRRFTAEDDRPGAAPVVQVSDRLWRRLGGRPDIVGSRLLLDGAPHTVVGVLPSTFRFVDAPRAPDVWLPLGSDPFRDRRFAPVASMGIVARLRDGVPIERARAELAERAHAIGREFPPLRGWTLLVESFRRQLTGGRQPLIVALAGAAGLVLVIACANLTALLMVRTAARERELAVRRALGASRGRLVRHLLAESLLLAAGGGIAGVLAAAWTSDALSALAGGAPTPFVPWRVLAEDVQVERTTIMFTLLVSAAAGVLAGLGPALSASRAAALPGTVRLGAAGSASGARSALVAVQVALSLVLLTGASLLGRSFAELAAIDPGFVAEHAVAAELALPASAYPEAAAIVSFFEAVSERLTSLPQVNAAGAGTLLPLAGVPPSTDIRIEGEPPPEPGREARAEYSAVTPNWFAAAGVRLVAGRLLLGGDDAGAPRAAVINEALARAYFPERNPLGQRLALSNEALKFIARDRPPVHDFASAYRVIVGVVADVRQGTLEAPPAPAVYVPLAQRPERHLTMVVRGRGDPHALAAALRDAVREIDSAQPIGDVRVLEDVLDAATGDSRRRAQFTGALALLALLLAAIGVYGVVAYAAAQRTREFGIRIALGAQSGDILRLSARQGLLPALAGAALGLPAAAAAAAAIGALLFGVPPFDLPAFVVALALLGTVVAAAAWWPARRATRVDPARALRVE